MRCQAGSSFESRPVSPVRYLLEMRTLALGTRVQVRTLSGLRSNDTLGTGLDHIDDRVDAGVMPALGLRLHL